MGFRRARQIITSVTPLTLNSTASGGALIELLLTIGIFFTAIALQRERLATWHRQLAELEELRWNEDSQ